MQIVPSSSCPNGRGVRCHLRPFLTFVLLAELDIQEALIWNPLRPYPILSNRVNTKITTHTPSPPHPATQYPRAQAQTGSRRLPRTTDARLTSHLITNPGFLEEITGVLAATNCPVALDRAVIRRHPLMLPTQTYMYQGSLST